MPKIKCEVCHREFQRKSTEIKRSEHHFCSQKCRGKFNLGKSVRTPDDFWNRMEKTKTCWLWKGAKNKSGYGFVTRGKRGQWSTHRYAWFLTNGPIPKGLCVCHSCDVPSCCNPAHLWLGTHTDNIRDAFKKNRMGRKLSKQIADQIRELYETGNYFQHELAARFGVGKGHIWQIVKKIHWI